MTKQATPIMLTTEQQGILESWMKASTTEQRMVQRSRIILMAAKGMRTDAIAEDLSIRTATVSKWRTRFAKDGLQGLEDAPRSGRRRKYDETTERRILAKLDDPVPDGETVWTARLIVKELWDVSIHHVWRIFRKHGIHLQRRHSWCISTDPEFATKAADVVGLYLASPENAVVLCVDEKPAIQALERAQGYLRLPNGRALTGFSHNYKRHGTTTLFAALEVTTGLIRAGHYNHRRRREFLDFMNGIVSQYPPKQELHVILDNLNTHKPKHDQWLTRHKNVHFHFTPTSASWLNQVEVWFSILTRRVLRNGSFTSPRQVREAIDRFLEAYNQDAAPFEWTKQVVHQSPLKKTYADLCK
jgi:transposase